MMTRRKLINLNKNHCIHFIYQNKYINKENLIINILPKITYGIITNDYHFLYSKRYIITFGWLIFDISVDFCYNLNK